MTTFFAVLATILFLVAAIAMVAEDAYNICVALTSGTEMTVDNRQAKKIPGTFRKAYATR